MGESDTRYVKIDAPVKFDTLMERLQRKFGLDKEEPKPTVTLRYKDATKGFVPLGSQTDLLSAVRANASEIEVTATPK